MSAIKLLEPALSHPALFEKETLAFLENFHFKGSKSSLDHVTAIAHYFSRLPYENISKIIKHDSKAGGLGFRLPDELTHDHFNWNMGGTCFSLTYFLAGIYSLLGYTAHPLICDLNWGSNNHSALQLDFNGQQFLIDPGYMIFSPLPLRRSTVQSRLSADTGIEMRYLEETEAYMLYTFRNGQYTRRYVFQNRSIPYSEFAQHWHSSFNLPGMDDLILTQVSGYEMTYIQGDFIKITNPDKVRKMREVNLADNLIRDRFGIPLEKVEIARQILKNRGH